MPANDIPNFVFNPCVHRCLSRFLDLLDKAGFDERSQRVTETISSSKFPELFQPSEPGDDEVAWHNLILLEDNGVVSIERTRKKGLTQLLPWEHARLVFHPEGEVLARQWLNRPTEDPVLDAWLSAAEEYKDHFQDLSILKPTSFPSLSHQTPVEVVKRLSMLPDLLAQSRLSLYQASAALFWGNSKALRGRERTLNQLFGKDVLALESRPILIEGAFRSDCEGLLVVENMDTFIAATDGRIPGSDKFTVLYAQGFKGASARIREPGMARFYWLSNSAPTHEWLEQFMSAWNGIGNLPVPIYYFGDLDPAGLRIFSQMRQVFPEIQPWKTGYELLLKRLDKGEGHVPEDSGKLGQGSVTNTGCQWMDEVAIPMMEKTGLCIDQEAAISGSHGF